MVFSQKNSIQNKGYSNSFSILYSMSFKESGWNHNVNNNTVYGNYSPRTANLYLGGEYHLSLSNKLELFSRIENQFIYTRYNSSSKFFINQIALTIGPQLLIYKKGMLSIPIRADIGFGYHLEKYYESLEQQYSLLKNGTFLLTTFGGGMNFQVSERSLLGVRLELRYQKGTADISLPTIETEDFYDFSSKMILSYQYAF